MANEANQQMCDREGCSAAATQSYLFDWGEGGVCCDHHAVLLNQIAQQTGRGVVLSPLRDIVVPLTRDERTQFRAQILTLEEEIETVKSRGLELYRMNEQIHKEMRLAQLRAEEARTQLVEAEAVNAELRAELSRRDAESASLLQELETLRLRASLEPIHGGGGGGQVVD